MKKPKLLIGYDDFRDLIEDGGYYVDKSLFIKELIDNSDKVTLITRSRRFGKTLNINMLKWFWENPECRVSQAQYYRKMDHLFFKPGHSPGGAGIS